MIHRDNKNMQKLLVLALMLVGATWCRQWDSANNPSLFGNFEYHLNQLPTSAKVKVTPWSDTYWPSYKGGIAIRWQLSGTPGFNYQLYTKADLLSGKVKIDLLSPAEKYDILVGRYDYPLVHSEWKRCSPQDAQWEGLCHGWAPAAIDYIQPRNVTMRSADNITVPLGSSDVKALLTYFLAEYAQQSERPAFCANRCNYDLAKNKSAENLPACWDINPGTYHVIVTNQLSKNAAFVADIDRSIEVWNQPISGYACSLGNKYRPANDSAPGTDHLQYVQCNLYYTKETKESYYSHDALTYTMKAGYYLDLDSSNKILGGSWDTWDRLDFVWKEDAPAFYGYFASLAQIYRAATNGTAVDKVRRVVTLDALKPTLVDATISLDKYADDTRGAWISAPATTTRLHFKAFSTRRNMDFVRVYEVDHNEVGALLGVFHGTDVPSDIVVSGKRLLVMFHVDPRAGRRVVAERGSGFDAEIIH